MKFTTELLAAGKTATGFQVPDEIVERLGAGKRPPVTVTINGYTYRNTVAVMGGQFLIGVSAEHRGGAGISAGDVIEVELQLDTGPRVVEVPADLASALEANPPAKASFDKLSYSNQRRHVLSIDDSKTPATRERRILKTVETLLAD